jgi:hypothetical protein
MDKFKENHRVKTNLHNWSIQKQEAKTMPEILHSTSISVSISIIKQCGLLIKSLALQLNLYLPGINVIFIHSFIHSFSSNVWSDANIGGNACTPIPIRMLLNYWVNVADHAAIASTTTISISRRVHIHMAVSSGCQNQEIG